MKSMFLQLIKNLLKRKKRVLTNKRIKQSKKYFVIICCPILRYTCKAAQPFGKLIILKTLKFSQRYPNKLLSRWVPKHLSTTPINGQSHVKLFTPQSPWRISSESLELTTDFTRINHLMREKTSANSLQSSKRKTTIYLEPYSTLSIKLDQWNLVMRSGEEGVTN
jgi:hypothetical protein